MILFGLEFSDKKYWCKSKSGENVYRSELLEKMWLHGYAYIGNVTYESCQYTAGYILKKITGKKSEEYYDGREVETATMSRRPGIGADWIDKYQSDVFPDDKLTIRSNVKITPPRYFTERIKNHQERKLRDPLILGSTHREIDRMVNKTPIKKLTERRKTIAKTKRQGDHEERLIDREQILRKKRKLYEEFKNANQNVFDL